MIEIREKDGGVNFLVRVQPRASRSEIVGEWQGALRVRLAAPPVNGGANEELRRFLAERLNVPIAAVRIAHGEHGRSKRVEVRGITAKQARNLAAPPAETRSPQTKSAMKSARGSRLAGAGD